MKIEIKEPESAFEAGALIFAGAFYLLVGKKDKRSWALIGWSIVTTLYFGVAKPAIDNYLTDRVKIEVAQPLSAPTSEFSLHSTAYAGEQGVPIIRGKNMYGYADTMWTMYKLKDIDAILAFHKSRPDGPPLKFSVENMDAIRMKYQQSK